MREILFRGRGTRGDKKWIEGDLFHGYNGYVGVTKKLLGIETWQVEPETVGQFTGVCDKNGTRIFEGDVIRDEDGDVMFVKWLTESAAFVLEPKPYASIYFYGALSSRIEVIGNIHDNPELIGGL